MLAREALFDVDENIGQLATIRYHGFRCGRRRVLRRAGWLLAHVDGCIRGRLTRKVDGSRNGTSISDRRWRSRGRRSLAAARGLATTIAATSARKHGGNGQERPRAMESSRNHNCLR
jgi:hypothetical protein